VANPSVGILGLNGDFFLIITSVMTRFSGTDVIDTEAIRSKTRQIDAGQAELKAALRNYARGFLASG
jgi:hypothetical protein